jgi:hypothetical protein
MNSSNERAEGERLTAWLSFWNKDERERNKAREPFEYIYVPYGEGHISVGDVIYCVGIEDKALRLFTRVEVDRLTDDPEHTESIRAYPASKIATDYQRVVPDSCRETLRYRRVNSSTSEPIKMRGRAVEPMQFRGPLSFSELAAGADCLDTLL